MLNDEMMLDHELEQLLQASRALPAFKKAVTGFVAGCDSGLIAYSPGTPRIKILRVIKKLLSHYPDEAVSDVEISGSSSCSAFEGILAFGPDRKEVRFRWDCHWRAMQEGLQTWYGEPDQAQAALTFGYRCFSLFEEVE